MFKIYKRDLADVEPVEYLGAAADATLSAGMAAKLSGGTLSKAGATAKPTHIVQGPARADGLFPAIRVLPTTVFETTSTAAVPETSIGSAVTLHTDGLSVTATATGGVFTIEQTENAANGMVRGRFL